ncbi:MAG TPA: GNAT family N-acetyltransferase [Solirubrobacterales bacterium]|nr:GNAT family N-acetyltransferase [Solirubrobacterales bacterium]
MRPRIDEQELRRRAIEGVREEVLAFGSGAPSSRLIERQGLIACLTPTSPQRSLFNSVYYDDPAVLAEQLEALAEAYDAAGVRAWTVWVPDEDRDTARLLARRGHALDAEPRAMALELAELAGEVAAPAGIAPGPIDAAICAELNDRAYGYGLDGFRAALAAETSIRWRGAFAGAQAVACVGAIEIGDDCCVTGVATLPEHRGRGIAGWLLRHVLAEARGRGSVTASLQATRAGAPLYERLGFRDFGFVEMWELRR